jgi:hypothetical protein
MLFSLAATWTIVSSVNEIESLLATSASANENLSVSVITAPEFSVVLATPAFTVNVSPSSTFPAPDQSVSAEIEVIS